MGTQTGTLTCPHIKDEAQTSAWAVALGAYFSLVNFSTMGPRLVVDSILKIAPPKAACVVMSSEEQNMLGLIMRLGRPMLSGSVREDAHMFFVNI